MNNKDRRSFVIELTDEGKSYKDKLVPLALELLKAGNKNINSDELEITRRVLKTMFDNLDSL